MNPLRRTLACALTAALLALAGCGNEAPPPAKTAAPAATAPAPAPVPASNVNAETKRLASEVWVYAFPLVLTEITRDVQTAGHPPNTFKHRRTTIPDASSGDVYPNADFLYSQAWLDLSKGPVVLTVPDTKGRYYLLALLDAYTNVSASIGKRTTGTEKREFAIVGPHYKGGVPEGTSEVKSPTELAWIFGRTEVKDKGDLASAVKVQEQYKVAEHGAKPAKGKAAPAAAAAANVDTKTPPRDQVAAMSAQTFFTHVAMLLPGNPPPKDDAPMLDKIRKLGIEPGKPFDMGKLDPLTAKSIEEGVKTAIDAVSTASKGLSGADIKNGWRLDRALGRWGTEYGRRAVAAWNGIGVNAPEDAIFMSTYLDGSGHKLDAAQGSYVLHFDASQIPPVDGFWSVSMYDEKGHFVQNPLGRNNIGSTDRLKTNPDGSLDIYISAVDPGGGKQGNWLPAPKGPFNIIMRLYWPKQDVIDGRWNPPGVRPAT
jgi:hypothetical protein